MGKDKHSSGDFINSDGDSAINPGKVGRDSTKYEQTKERSFKLVFIQNRSYELHVWQSCFKFEPMGSLVVPGWVVTHPDFIQQSDKFIVKEVL
jgi:hypothetical protein